MENPIQHPDQELVSFLRPWSLLRAGARCGLTALVMGAGMGCLAYLSDAYAAGGALMVTEQTADYAFTVARYSLLPMLFLGLQVEFLIHLLLSVRRSWQFCQVACPLFGAAVGGFLCWSFFSQPEYGPKHTMLLAGGAMVVFTGISLQLSLWYVVPDLRASCTDFPVAWYCLLILLSATFFGGLTGWRGDSPHLKELLEYRQRHWVERPNTPLLPGESLPDEPGSDTSLHRVNE